MTASTRKLLGSLVLLIGLTVYIVLVATVATNWLPLHWWVQVPFYLVAGIAWAIPMRPFMYWMNRPDPEEDA